MHHQHEIIYCSTMWPDWIAPVARWRFIIFVRSSHTTMGKLIGPGIHTNLYHPPYGYGYPPLQQLFADALQFYHHSLYDITHNGSLPTTSASQRFPCYGPLWQGCDLHKGGFGGSQMFLAKQFPGQGLPSLSALRVPLKPPWNNPVNLLTSSSSTSQLGPSSGIKCKIWVSLRMKDFSHWQNGGKWMPQETWACPYLKRCHSTNMTQMMRLMSGPTWAMERANLQFAQSNLNSSWSCFPNGSGRPSTVRWTSRRKNVWLGFWRQSISLFSVGRTIWNSFQTDPCTGRQLCQMLWRQSWTGCCWMISMMVNGFGGSGLTCY